MKNLRISLALVVLFLGGFYLDRAFLGGQGTGQAQYLWLMVKIVLTIVICAAALLGLFKLVSRLWDRMAERMAGDAAPPTEDSSHKDKE